MMGEEGANVALPGSGKIVSGMTSKRAPGLGLLNHCPADRKRPPGR